MLSGQGGLPCWWLIHPALSPAHCLQIRAEAAARAAQRAAELEAERQRAEAEAAKYKRKQKQLEVGRRVPAAGHRWLGPWTGRVG